MKRLIIVFHLILSIVLVSCNNEDIAVKKPIEVNQPKENDSNISNDSIENNESGIHEFSKFAIKINDKYLSLRDWDNEVNLSEVLGDPKSERTEILGQGSDTFSGSYIRTLYYDGLELKMFSPQQDGVHFWVLSMDITSPKYSTTKNIKVGDTIKKLKESYSDLDSMKDGRTDPNNSAYIIMQEGEWYYLSFEVKDAIITEIKIYYEMQ